ncbi:MAG: CHASE2 domain-containing protein, partial [bacterium]|nr:CHASE2 domain-containing protein [bacterium]
DMRFGLTDAELPDNILHIDIDDGSLEAVGRWPWPRERFASIIDILKECGAKSVMVDLILDEPEKDRYVSQANDTYTSSDEELLADAPPQPVSDDTIFASSISRAGNVFLAMHLDLESQASATSETYDEISQFMSDNPDLVDLEAVRSAVPQSHRNTIPMAYLNHRSVAETERFAIPPGRVDALDIRSGRMAPPIIIFAESAAGIGCV